MDSDLIKVLVCVAVASVLLAVALVGTSVSAPAELRRDEEVPCSDEDEMVQYEDEFCSGATPDCPSHWEAWDSLPPTTN